VASFCLNRDVEPGRPEIEVEVLTAASQAGPLGIPAELDQAHGRQAEGPGRRAELGANPAVRAELGQGAGHRRAAAQDAGQERAARSLPRTFHHDRPTRADHRVPQAQQRLARVAHVVDLLRLLHRAVRCDRPGGDADPALPPRHHERDPHRAGRVERDPLAAR
jgi:hypothetical protein